ncbi:squalene-associated FAD-dependent desaturase [Nitrospirillum amazonense]|uniref:Squalene-associated FAD-dependent desaturase n=1 Tax=Nitrospirillum amazonense TaxID=28077 RepID=A0A560FT78_9PROT|nr:hydroxysqualene dehydroxylase HpnE [Nitrospirillum amazonense]TWB24761.1 squalene-associated FAD-dependent desaturase [Nitrospirillum amazonense]
MTTTVPSPGAASPGPTVHVVGAGLAGLAAAVRLTQAGRRVRLYEAAAQAGGRCRSYDEPNLGIRIDNGSHLMVSGNHAAMAYLRATHGPGRKPALEKVEYRFWDGATGRRWQVRPNHGKLPWWALVPSRRVPGTKASDYLAGWKLMRADPLAPIGEVLACSGPAWDTFFRPVLLAALNTEPEQSAAGLAGAIIRETLAQGGAAYQPLLASGGLSPVFVDPALEWLAAHGAEIVWRRRLRALRRVDQLITALDFGTETIELKPDDRVVLAVPAWVAADLLPGLTTPTEHRSILNVHFRLDRPAGMPRMTGMINTVGEWAFAYDDHVSVTVSGADRLMESDREETAGTIWGEIAALANLDRATPLPRWQVVKEKRATFAALPEQVNRRPNATAAGKNLVLAGDWTATGLPSTIEGAIRSGFTAADAILTAR